jgi:hypothetical protein
LAVKRRLEPLIFLNVRYRDHGVPGGENMLRRMDGSVHYFTVRESIRIQTFPDTSCSTALGRRSCASSATPFRCGWRRSSLRVCVGCSRSNVVRQCDAGRFLLDGGMPGRGEAVEIQLMHVYGEPLADLVDSASGLYRSDGG